MELHSRFLSTKIDLPLIGTFSLSVFKIFHFVFLVSLSSGRFIHLQTTKQQKTKPWMQHGYQLIISLCLIDFVCLSFLIVEWANKNVLMNSFYIYTVIQLRVNVSGVFLLIFIISSDQNTIKQRQTIDKNKVCVLFFSISYLCLWDQQDEKSSHW